MRIYDKKSSVVFAKTGREWGEYSNMHNKYPISLGNILLSSSEAVYQLSRFPNNPDVQQLIINESRPMGSKFIAKDHIEKSRKDWDEVRVEVMRWVIRLKFSQHYDALLLILKASGDAPIVEYSKNDQFWGVTRNQSNELEGNNILGRLWSELRMLALTKPKEFFAVVHPPAIENFMINNSQTSTWYLN